VVVFSDLLAASPLQGYACFIPITLGVAQGFAALALRAEEDGRGWAATA